MDTLDDICRIILFEKDSMEDNYVNYKQEYKEFLLRIKKFVDYELSKIKENVGENTGEINVDEMESAL